MSELRFLRADAKEGRLFFRKLRTEYFFIYSFRVQYFFAKIYFFSLVLPLFCKIGIENALR